MKFLKLEILVKNEKEYKQFIHENDLFISIRYSKKGYSFKSLFYFNLENFSYYEYLNSISFHPPVMIITTLVFFYIRRKILLKGEKH